MDKISASAVLIGMQDKVIARNGHENMVTISFCMAMELIFNKLSQDIENNAKQLKTANKFFVKAML